MPRRPSRGPPRWWRQWLGCTLLLALATSARESFAAQWEVNSRLWAGAGFDSNARRDYASALGEGLQPDLFAFALGNAEALFRFESPFALRGRYDVAGRKFMVHRSQDTLVQEVQLQGEVTVLPSLSLGLRGQARDRRGAERDYTDLSASLMVDALVNAAVNLRLTGGARRFLYYNRFEYSASGPEGALSVQYRVSRRHRLSAFGSFSPRTYDGNATPRPPVGDEAPAPVRTRVDSVFGGGLSYSFQGPFQAAVAYGYFDQTSNSYGETLRRHRFSVTAGFRLPWRLTFLGGATYQLAFFPDGVYLSPDLTVVDDDENASSATLKLVRPLSKYFEIDVRYALYVNVLPQNQFLYLRQVASLGLAIHFP